MFIISVIIIIIISIISSSSTTIIITIIIVMIIIIIIIIIVICYIYIYMHTSKCSKQLQICSSRFSSRLATFVCFCALEVLPSRRIGSLSCSHTNPRGGAIASVDGRGRDREAAPRRSCRIRARAQKENGRELRTATCSFGGRPTSCFGHGQGYEHG